MYVRKLCGGRKNVCEIYVQLRCNCIYTYCNCVCVGLEREGKIVLFLDCVHAAIGGQNFRRSCAGGDLVCPMLG